MTDFCSCYFLNTALAKLSDIIAWAVVACGFIGFKGFLYMKQFQQLLKYLWSTYDKYFGSTYTYT